MTPFTAAEFFEVFTRYHRAVGPAPVLLALTAVGIVGLAIRPTSWSGRAIAAGLGGLWLWTGAVYHLGFFTRATSAAWLFGALFLAQGALFLRAGVARREITFRARADRTGWLGGVFALYAIAIYPLVGQMAGHVYPAAPTFGTPCPTTIFTFAALLWADRQVPRHLLAIPLLWSLFASSAVFAFGVVQDVGLPVAGVVGTAAILWRDRNAPRGDNLDMHVHA